MDAHPLMICPSWPGPTQRPDMCSPKVLGILSAS